MRYGACYRFTDDFGNEVYPYKLSYKTYMARYYFFYDLSRSHVNINTQIKENICQSVQKILQVFATN